MTNSERREYNINRTLDVALDCFQELGIEVTTQAVLAKRVQLTTKTIQRYFGPKEHIVLLTMKRLNERYYELIEQQLSKMDFDSMSGLDELLAFLAAHKVFFEPQNRVLLLMTEMHLYLVRHHIQESHIFMEINAFSTEFRRIKIGLEKGILDGSVRKDLNPELAYAFFTSSFAGMVQRMMMPETYEGDCNGIDKKEILAYYIQIIKADLQPK